MALPFRDAGLHGQTAASGPGILDARPPAMNSGTPSGVTNVGGMEAETRARRHPGGDGVRACEAGVDRAERLWSVALATPQSSCQDCSSFGPGTWLVFHFPWQGRG